jgi:peptidoglycan/LPS O-acetylase OafA/YrhL
MTLTGGLDRQRNLDGLRGVAILLTLFLHYVCRSGIFTYLGPPPVAALLDSAWAGVDIFFVLSGFLIGGIILDEGKAEGFFGLFYLRRMLRILPVAFLTLAFSYIVLPLLNPTILWHVQVPPYAYLLFINNFWTALGRISYAPLAPMWSLAIEFQFYLLAPALLRSASPALRTTTLVAVILLSPLLRLGAVWFSAWDFTFYRLDGFATGILLASLLRSAYFRELVKQHRAAVHTIIAASIVTAVLFASYPYNLTSQQVARGVSLNSIAAGAVILFLYMHPGGLLSKALSQSWLVVSGRYSYFLYLMHTPILMYTMSAYNGGPPALRPLLALGLSYFGAWASWRFLESKLIRLGKRASYQPITQPAAP